MSESVRIHRPGWLYWAKYGAQSLATMLLGALPGIFVVFLSVFGDVHSTSDRIEMWLYVLGVYLFLAAVIAILTRSRTVPPWLGLAGTIILIAYSQHEPDVAPTAAASFAAIALGIGLGTAAGLWIRGARSHGAARTRRT